LSNKVVYKTKTINSLSAEQHVIRLHSECPKCPSLALTHAVRRWRHYWTATAMMSWSSASQLSQQSMLQFRKVWHGRSVHSLLQYATHRIKRVQVWQVAIVLVVSKSGVPRHNSSTVSRAHGYAILLKERRIIQQKCVVAYVWQ